jgi:hypothetical protein
MYVQLKEKNNLDIWAHKTSLTPPCFIEVPVPEPSQQSERPCICVSGHRSKIDNPEKLTNKR